MRFLGNKHKRLAARLGALVMAAAVLLQLLPAPQTAEASYSIDAAAACVMDVESGQLLFNQNADKKLYPASTTKIMTALLVLENLELNDEIRVPDDFVNDGEASIWLEPGEKHTVEGLLMAMMLRSANDAAQVLAIGVSGSVEKFAELMNEKAAELGCENTHFVNPNGLHDKDHYTTARDLATIARAAMQYEDFNRIIVTERYQLPWVEGEYDRVVYNRNAFLDKWEAADGVKTGYTSEAGSCLVSSATVDGRRFIGVVLNCPDMYDVSKDMLQYFFKTYKTVDLVAKDESFGEVTVLEGKVEKVSVCTDRALTAVLPGNAATDYTTDIYLPESVPAPVRAGDILGSVCYTDSQGTQYIANLVATETVQSYSFTKVFKEAWGSIWQVFMVPIIK